MTKQKCLIVLSEKSSGSSALQTLLASVGNIQHVRSTRHYENETLYWTKAASVLGLAQIDMVDSEVPIPRDQARADLIELLARNLRDPVAPVDDHDLIFGGWAQLCAAHAPVFIEKSPHHLCQWSALELILQCSRELTSVDFLLVGLVRNPMDTIYSQYRRWKSRPEAVERQWLTGYRNLQRLRQTAGERLVIVRYEDMVNSLDCLQPVLEFCGSAAGEVDPRYFHRNSVSKWKRDPLFGFVPSPELMELAADYGYGPEELANDPAWFWPAVREVSRAGYKTVAPLKSLAKQAIGRA